MVNNFNWAFNHSDSGVGEGHILETLFNGEHISHDPLYKTHHKVINTRSLLTVGGFTFVGVRVHLEINHTADNDIVLLCVVREVVKGSPQASEDERHSRLLHRQSTLELIKFDLVMDDTLALDVSPNTEQQVVGSLNHGQFFLHGLVSLDSLVCVFLVCVNLL